MKSGGIVDDRDHVLMCSLLPPARATFAASFGSMYGPFLMLRPT
jgi:hypothetical protein